jgi:hypothetical protein
MKIQDYVMKKTTYAEEVFDNEIKILMSVKKNGLDNGITDKLYQQLKPLYVNNSKNNINN